VAHRPCGPGHSASQDPRPAHRRRGRPQRPHGGPLRPRLRDHRQRHRPAHPLGRRSRNHLTVSFPSRRCPGHLGSGLADRSDRRGVQHRNGRIGAPTRGRGGDDGARAGRRRGRRLRRWGAPGERDGARSTSTWASEMSSGTRHTSIRPLG